MNIRLLSLLLAFFALTGAAQPGKLVREGQAISWSMGEGRKVYRLGDLTAVFDRVQCAPIGEGCEEEDVDPVLTITRTDGRSVRLEGSGMQNILMLGRLTKGGPVSAFFQAYSGGMHCCQQMVVVTQEADGLKTVELGAYDGAEIAWPKDIDGDGTLDFVVADDRFLYAFESYAASLAPPMILNVRDGRKVDVTGDPRYAKRIGQEAEKLRRACVKEEFPNGACAAYAAMAAKAGKLDAAWPVILAEYRKDSGSWPEGCKVARVGEDRECPEGQVIEYPDYPTALRAFLAETGYIPSP